VFLFDDIRNLPPQAAARRQGRLVLELAGLAEMEAENQDRPWH